jgi:hypothetical protein
MMRRLTGLEDDDDLIRLGAAEVGLDEFGMRVTRCSSSMAKSIFCNGSIATANSRDGAALQKSTIQSQSAPGRRERGRPTRRSPSLAFGAGASGRNYFGHYDPSAGDGLLSRPSRPFQVAVTSHRRGFAQILTPASSDLGVVSSHQCRCVMAEDTKCWTF